MKLVFLSNYYSHHQALICENWYKLTNKEFCFVATEPFSQERIQLGWGTEPQPFIVQYEAESARSITSLVNQADAVILGSAPFNLVKSCLEERKIVFKYSERVFKRGYNRWKWFPRVLRYWCFYGRHKSLYLLCASAYTATDYALHGTFIGKSYKWGYFPETKHYNTSELFAKKKKNKILWCGRFLDWKHPDDALEVAKRLEIDGYDFEMDFIGTGEMEKLLQNRINAYHLSTHVKLLGAMKPEEVRVHMESAGIYLFTSDFQEGWGAVLNESMNSGCAVVASHAIGSVPFLVKHGENGLVYQSGHVDGLYRKVKYLLDHPEQQRYLGENAYHTIADLWNGEEASRRLLKLTKQISETGKCDLYENGPCSRAKIIKNNWFVEDLNGISENKE